jgi:hypothetical protein
MTNAISVKDRLKKQAVEDGGKSMFVQQWTLIF